MKKIILSVIFAGALAIASCTQKTEEKPLLLLAKNTIFLPETLVATAD